MTIGEKIRYRRNELGMTQQTVADQLHITRQTISNWENDKSTPDLQTIINLSDIYQISLDDLLKNETNLAKKITAKAEYRGFRKSLILFLAPILIAFYLLPLTMTDGGSEIAIFGVIIPVIIFITGITYGYTYGWHTWYPILIGSLFIPTLFINLNMSALGFIPVFIFISYSGIGLGTLIRQITKKRTDI